MSDGSSIAAVRGAISVPANDAEEIRGATARLLTALLERNALDVSRIVSAVFTATPDLDADFPAHAARKLGWTDVPLLGAREIDVPGAPARIVRVLLTVSGVAPGRRLEPVYLDGAAALRPDLARKEDLPVRWRVAIVGLGQIGGSIGLALRGRGFHRTGFDQDERTLASARDAGAIDEAADLLETACAEADLAVLATPVDGLPALIERAAHALRAGTALLDTGSARVTVTAALERAAALGVTAVGGHPIAGGEGHGIAAARADLFRGAPFALMPVGGDVPAVVRELVEAIGARPLEVSAADHDHALARTSHLPYLVACALQSIGEDSARRDLSGPGYRSMTRLAASDEHVALAYCRANLGEIAAAWKELRRALDARIAELG
jgi:prephenate dehydrogenase